MTSLGNSMGAECPSLHLIHLWKKDKRGWGGGGVGRRVFYTEESQCYLRLMKTASMMVEISMTMRSMVFMRAMACGNLTQEPVAGTPPYSLVLCIEIYSSFNSINCVFLQTRNHFLLIWGYYSSKMQGNNNRKINFKRLTEVRMER